MTSAITTHSAASSQRCPAIIHAVEICICFIVLYGELIEAEQTKMIHPEFAYTLTTPLCVSFAAAVATTSVVSQTSPDRQCRCPPTTLVNNHLQHLACFIGCLHRQSRYRSRSSGWRRGSHSAVMKTFSTLTSTTGRWKNSCKTVAWKWLEYCDCTHQSWDCVSTAKLKLWQRTDHKVCHVGCFKLLYYIASKLLILLHLFNGFFSGTTWVSRYQKSETSLDLN